MNKELLARRKTAEDSFNLLAEQKAQKEQETNEMLTEMVRLQGEMRVLDGLLNQKPDTIDATSVDPKEKK